MKKLGSALFFLFFSIVAHAQIDQEGIDIKRRSEAIGHYGDNELKINMFNTVLGLADLSYERLLADNMGFGVSVSVSLDKTLKKHFVFLPYYRLYFGDKKANGYFLEGNMAVVSFKENVEQKNITTTYGVGAAFGHKLLFRNGFFGEAFLGLGKIMEHDSYLKIYPRVGLSFGKRF